MSSEASIRRESDMALVFSCSARVLKELTASMLESGSVTRFMAMVTTSILMAVNTRAISSKANSTASECFGGQLTAAKVILRRITTKESGLKAR